MDYPTVFLTGPTCCGKSEAVLKIAKESGAYVLPLDQLHLYEHLRFGVSRDPVKLASIRSVGYAWLSPWTVFPPHQYVEWVLEKVSNLARQGPVLVEGGCTSYLRELLERNARGGGPERGVFIAFGLEQEEGRIRERIGELCSRRITDIVKETEMLCGRGFIGEEALEFFGECEKLFTHPEDANPQLAWAIRIAARVYYPAYLALLGRLSKEDACERLIGNVMDIHAYQCRRIRAMFDEFGFATDLPEREWEETLKRALMG